MVSLSLTNSGRMITIVIDSIHVHHEQCGMNDIRPMKCFVADPRKSKRNVAKIRGIVQP